MSTFNLNMRKRCTMDAIQKWIDAVQPGFRVIDIKSPNPVALTIVLSDDEPEPPPPPQVPS